VFLMGDHRQNSEDSRTFGTVAVSQVIGRAWLRYWPLGTFGILPTPTYPELASTSP
jgi:signal peptidase I